VYKIKDNSQINFLRFKQPLGLHMNPNNLWIKMADSIPKYASPYKDKNGNIVKPIRLALGSLIIQIKYQYSDHELVEHILVK
jgi:IS5 family transposase